MATQPAVGLPHIRSTAAIRESHLLSATSRQSIPFRQPWRGKEIEVIQVFFSGPKKILSHPLGRQY
jgi:hypothetical protein